MSHRACQVSTEYVTICQASLPLVALSLLKAKLIKVQSWPKPSSHIVAESSGISCDAGCRWWDGWQSFVQNFKTFVSTSKSLRIPISKMNPNHCTLPNSLNKISERGCVLNYPWQFNLWPSHFCRCTSIAHCALDSTTCFQPLWTKLNFQGKWMAGHCDIGTVRIVC